jgi:hypothetical protein
MKIFSIISELWFLAIATILLLVIKVINFVLSKFSEVEYEDEEK